MFFREQRNLQLSNFVFTSNSFNDNMIPEPESVQYSKSVLPEDNIGNSNSDFSCTTIEKNKQVYKRKLFTEEEDNLLKKAALTYQNVSWNDIAKFVPGRTPKQCRDRWVNYLQPSLKNSPFSEDEDRLLFFLVSIYGTHWSKMKSHFPTRSTNSIKNRWCWFTKDLCKNSTNCFEKFQNNCKSQNNISVNNSKKSNSERINDDKITKRIKKPKKQSGIPNKNTNSHINNSMNQIVFDTYNLALFDDDIVSFEPEELDWEI